MNIMKIYDNRFQVWWDEKYTDGDIYHLHN